MGFAANNQSVNWCSKSAVGEGNDDSYTVTAAHTQANADARAFVSRVLTQRRTIHHAG